MVGMRICHQTQLSHTHYNPLRFYTAEADGHLLSSIKMVNGIVAIMLKQNKMPSTAVCFDWPLGRLRECLAVHDYQGYGQQLGCIANRSELLASKLLQRTYMHLPFMQHHRVDRYHRCAQEFLRGFTQTLQQSIALAREYDDYFMGANYSRNLAEFVESRQIWQRFDDLVQHLAQVEPLPCASPSVIDLQRIRQTWHPRVG